MDGHAGHLLKKAIYTPYSINAGKWDRHLCICRLGAPLPVQRKRNSLVYYPFLCDGQLNLSCSGQSCQARIQYIAMKTAFLATIPWLVSPSAAGPLLDTIGRDDTFPQRRAGFTDFVSTHAIPMKKHSLAPSTTHPASHRRANGPAPLKNVHDVYYSIDLEVGNQTVAVSVDTGSSDTWMVQEPYECVSFWFDPRDPDGVSGTVLSLRFFDPCHKLTSQI